MIYNRNWRFSATGDPYGNRTRVSAVKGLFALESMARPAFRVLFLPLCFNGLQERGGRMTPDIYMGELLERVAQMAEDAALFHAQQAAHHNGLEQGWRDAVKAGQAYAAAKELRAWKFSHLGCENKS